MTISLARPLRASHWLLNSRVDEPPNRDSVKRILVAAQMGIGNLVMFTPFLRALRAGYPQAHIALVFWKRNSAEEVVSGSTWVDEVIHLDTDSQPLRKRVLQGIRLGRRGWDMGIARFNGMPEEILAAFVFGRIPFRVGHTSGPDWTSGNDYLFNCRVSMKTGSHEVDRYLELARALELPDEGRTPVFHFTAIHRVRAEAVLAELGVPAGERFVAIQPGTSEIQAWKRWPRKHWRVFMREIERLHVPIVAFGSKSERPLIDQIGRQGRLLNAAGLLSLADTAAALQRASALVCTDSGLMHVAAAVRTPVVALFGPTDDRRTSPIGDNHRILLAGCSERPCLDWSGLRPGCRGSVCMEAIDPALVASELERLLTTAKVN